MQIKNNLTDIIFVDAEPSRISRPIIEKFAEKISVKYEITSFNGKDDPLLQFTKEIGGRVHFQDPSDFFSTESGSIKVRKQNDFDIYLSTFTGPLRDRFTIAHELGHYFIHSKQGEIPIQASRKGSGRLEWEANWFAAALLMPRKEFNEISRKFNDNIYSIAGHFEVSTQAVSVRQEQIRNG